MCNAITKFFFWLLTPIYLNIRIFQMRLGWWAYRRKEGYPISLFRAFLKPHPRFSAYEENEEGCPEWAKRDYELVKEK